MNRTYSLFDLHCDTALCLARKKLHLLDNDDCHISLNKAAYLDKYVQIFAVFTPRSMSNSEGFDNFISTSSYLIDELNINSEIIAPLCLDRSDIVNAIKNKKRCAILAVEDVRILDGDINRIDLLVNRGVRFVTPVWGGESCIGGAHNTECGLTEFGQKAVKEMSKRGIIMDLSHSNEKTADGIIEAVKEVGGKAIATHSNSASVYMHTRNLLDKHFENIKELGGIVGISLCPPHISAEAAPDIDSIIRHIDRYMELGGENTVAIGGDLDGTDLPTGFNDISDIYKISDRLSALGYSDIIINKIFFDNAYNFAVNNL